MPHTKYPHQKRQPNVFPIYNKKFHFQCSCLPQNQSSDRLPVIRSKHEPTPNKIDQSKNPKKLFRKRLNPKKGISQDLQVNSKKNKYDRVKHPINCSSNSPLSTTDLPSIKPIDSDSSHDLTKFIVMKEDLIRRLQNLWFLVKCLQVNIKSDLSLNLEGPSVNTRENCYLIYQGLNQKTDFSKPNHREIWISTKDDECGLPVVWTIWIEGVKHERKIVAIGPDPDYMEYSLLQLIKEESLYLPSLVTSKTYLNASYELENFLFDGIRLLSDRLSIVNVDLSSVLNSLDTALDFITILLFQLERSSERRNINECLNTTAILFLNFLVSNPNLFVLDEQYGNVISKYYGEHSDSAKFYGIQLYDLEGHLVKIGTGAFFAEMYGNFQSLDLLTFKTNNLVTFNPQTINTVSFGTALYQLKEYYSTLKCLIQNINKTNG